MTRLRAVRRSVATLALAPVLLAGLVACGDDDGSGASGPAGSGGSAVAAVSDLEPGDAVEPADFADLLADSLGNITTAHVTMAVDVGAGEMTGDGDLDYTGETPATAMTMSAEMLGSDIDARLVDGAMYLNLGELSQGKFWKVDLDDPDSPFGALGTQLDIKAAMARLEKGLTSVEYVGEDDSLDHYRASVDSAALIEGMGPMASQGAPALPESIDYDVWIDDQGRLTKLAFAMGDVGSTEMELSDFGADVSIEAPADDEVAEMPDVFGEPGTDPQA